MFLYRLLTSKGVVGQHDEVVLGSQALLGHIGGVGCHVVGQKFRLDGIGLGIGGLAHHKGQTDTVKDWVTAHNNKKLITLN